MRLCLMEAHVAISRDFGWVGAPCVALCLTKSRSPGPLPTGGVSPPSLVKFGDILGVPRLGWLTPSARRESRVLPTPFARQSPCVEASAILASLKLLRFSRPEN